MAFFKIMLLPFSIFTCTYRLIHHSLDERRYTKVIFEFGAPFLSLILRPIIPQKPSFWTQELFYFTCPHIKDQIFLCQSQIFGIIYISELKLFFNQVIKFWTMVCSFSIG